jgi:CubicO group peptidase (beta-lactamase class C family)
VYDFSAFEQEIQAFVDEEPAIDGVGAILVHRDEGVIYRRSFGAFADDRIYLIASASKMITAGVLMRLADEGLLDMDEPIVEAVGDWGDHNPAITPAQLLSNSSGLVGLLQNPAYGPYLCQYLYTGTLQDCARIIFTTQADDELVIPPDTEFRYGGAQWQVAGALAEIVTGKSWAELIEETYTEPCGLESLGYNNHFLQFAADGGSPFNYPPSFDGDPSRLLPTDNPNTEGGAYASIGDYGKLLLMHLRGGLCDGGRVLSEDAVRRMREDRILAYGGVAPRAFEGYGLGWWIDRDNPALAADPGAFGAFPWIDEDRDYAGFFAIEATTVLGTELFTRTIALVTEAIDEAR